MDITKELKNELKEAYQDEIVSAFNYMALSKRLEGFFGEDVSRELEEDFLDEVEHAERIAAVLDEVFDTPVPYPSKIDMGRQKFLETQEKHSSENDDIADALKAIAEAEYNAIDRYSNIAELASETGYPDVRHFAEELLSEERSHLNETESLLTQFE